MINNQESMGYLGNPMVKKAGLNWDFTQEESQEYANCIASPTYFLKNFVKVVSLDDGIVPFDLWKYQEKMIYNFDKHRFNIVLACRQSGKTVSTAAYLLWYAMFKPNKTVAILANKAMIAKEILDRIVRMLEHTPFFLQVGVKSLNKSYIQFGNGSKIVAAATSSSSIRGFSVNLLMLDEFAFVENSTTFYTSTYPVIISGKSTKVIITSTANGMGNMFYKLWNDAINDRNQFNPFQVDWWDVPERDEKWKEDTIANTSPEQFEQEFGNKFLGNSNTLICAETLETMSYNEPIVHKDSGLDIYETPQPDHKYITVVDTSKGINRDFSAFSVIDITEVPYRQVAKYKNNMISPLLYPSVIFNVATAYNESYTLVELNDIGQEVADILKHDLEYDNMLACTTKGRSGQVLSTGFGKNFRWGVRTSTAVKMQGCANLKSLIEKQQLYIEDFDTIAELSTFVVKGKSYEADEGCNDDLAMTLVLFAWCVNQNIFRELSDTNVRKTLYEQKMDQEAEELSPIGEFPKEHYAQEAEKFVDTDGTMWSTVETFH